MTQQELVAFIGSIANKLRGPYRPHVPDAWVDHAKTRLGFEIPVNRHFYKYVPPRPLEVIESELRTLEGEILALLGEGTP